jgi:hypothetical protein
VLTIAIAAARAGAVAAEDEDNFFTHYASKIANDVIAW